MSGRHNEDGNDTEYPEHSTPTRSPPPTLKPFLDNLPTPALVRVKDNISSVLHRNSLHGVQPPPTNAIFEIGEDDENEGEDLEEDDGFHSQSSRHNSSASSVGSDEAEDQEEDDGNNGGQQIGMHQVQRVSSMPISSAVEQHYGMQSTLHTSRSTTALLRGPPPLPPPLYPPFYNKPPTPIPPSPSLTSLLRPPSLLNRSTTSTRPTTPDSSDVETPNDTEAAVAHSARRANPLPPTAPKVPTYEYYGFVLYLASSLAFLMYILWSYLPSPFLHALGITYYPNRWWSLAIPAWIVMVLIYIYIALACWNVEYLTLGLQRLETMVDEAGSVAILDENGRLRRGGSKRFMSELDERKRRENMSHAWERRKKGGGSGRGSKKKDKKDRDREEELYGYTGEITDTGVASGLSWKHIWNDGTDAVLDVPIGGVCQVLYGEGTDLFLR